MKRFTEAVCLTAMVLVLAGLSAGQSGPPPTFQTGDVFVGVSGFGDAHGQVLWYGIRTPQITPQIAAQTTPQPTLLATLDTGQANTETTGMAFDSSGYLYATVFEANNIVKFNSSGTLLGPFGSGYNSHPEAILFDSGGNAYAGEADGSGQVLKFESSGKNLLAEFSPATENRGTDWIDFAADQKTLYYTSEGTHVKRFDRSTNMQLSDLNSEPLPAANKFDVAYALRILNDGSVLVADTDRVIRLDSSGNIVQTYFASCIEPSNLNPFLFALTLAPDGMSFWTADNYAGTVVNVNIATRDIATLDIATPCAVNSTIQV